MRLRATCFEEQTPLTRAIDGVERFFRRAWYNVLTWRERRAWDRAAEPLRADAAKLIPADTCYCYAGRRSNACPFWCRAPRLPEQENGYCSFLRVGDWQDDGAFLLWDQVKECGINRRDHGEGPTP